MKSPRRLARKYLLPMLLCVVVGSVSAQQGPSREARRETTLEPAGRPAKAPAVRPDLVWSTYLGGSKCDRGRDIAMDRMGNIYVGGYTRSADFPTTKAYDATHNGGEWDIFLSKLSSDGRLVWSTYLGTRGGDWSWRMTADRAGNAYVVGRASNADFPVPAGWDTTYNGGIGDCFVSKFSPDGELVWSTFLGGNDLDLGYGVAVDEAGNVYVTGRTSSADFPTPGGWDKRYGGGGHDAFVAKFSAEGKLLWSTYLGGNGTDFAFEIAVDTRENVYVTGETHSVDFPTLGGFDTSFNGGDGDAYVAKFSADGQLLWSTYLGGNSIEKGLGVVASSADHVYVAGRTMSADFPTAGGDEESFRGKGDVFVSKLSSDGALLWSAFLGGSSYEIAAGVGVDAAGNVYVSGRTTSADFPTPGGWDITYNGGDGDCFVSKFSSGGALLWSTFLGGGAREGHGLLAVDPMGNIVITGDTDSTDFPTPGGWDTTYNGGDNFGGDAFVAKFRQIPPLATRR